MEEAAQILEIETFIPLLLQVRINFNSIKTNFQENDIFVAQRLRREKFAGLKCEIICYNSHNFSSRITGMSLGFSDKWLTMASITNPCLKKLLVKFHLIIELVQFCFDSTGPALVIGACYAPSRSFALVTGDDDVISFHSNVPRGYLWPNEWITN